MKLLIVEDDDAINQLLFDILIPTYKIVQAYSGTEAIRLCEQETFDLVLLDLTLPGKDGQTVLLELRKKSSCPVIIISAMSDITNRVLLLEQGADDYITKPFDNREVLARVAVQLRKNNTTPEDVTSIQVANLIYNSGPHQLLCNNEELTLTQKELDLLLLFMKNPTRVFTKATLYETIWGDTYFGDDNTLSVHISRLRKIISEHQAAVQIETVWGIGFKLTI